MEETLNKADIELINTKIRKIPDFPKPGVLFYDIFSILCNSELSQKLFNLCEVLIKNFIAQGNEVNVIIGLESRGFLIGQVLADRLKLPFVPIRKKNKLPGGVLKVNYSTEYSQDTFELQEGILNEDTKALVVDDLLATGGSLNASAKLIEMAKGKLSGYFCVFEVSFLKGRNNLLQSDKMVSLISI